MWIDIIPIRIPQNMRYQRLILLFFTLIILIELFAMIQENLLIQ